ncbi:MAG: DNA/RNA nuclease SfsA [Desulfurococcaceae archaeon]
MEFEKAEGRSRFCKGEDILGCRQLMIRGDTQLAREIATLISGLELQECIILKRNNLFTLEALMRGSTKIVYINNTGRLAGVLERGKKGYCAKNASGSLAFRIIGVEEGEYATLVDTMLQERAFLIAQREGLIKWLLDCRLLKRNYRLDSETIDLAYACGDQLVLVELKSAIMKLAGGYAGYPDAPTVRGRRQIKALADYVKGGGRAVLVFIAGVPFASGFKLYCRADREIKDVIDYAAQSGLELRAVNTCLDPQSKSVILLGGDLPVELSCA